MSAPPLPSQAALPPSPPMPPPGEGQCGIFEGTHGMLILFGVSAGAFFLYALLFACTTCLKWARRSQFVFWLDLIKIGLAQIASWGVNFVNTHRNAVAGFDPLAWYLPTFLADEVVCVPLGVIVGKLLTGIFRLLGTRCGLEKWTGALHHFGRYAPESGESQGLLSAPSSSAPRASWWFAQLVLWVGCVVGTRFLVGGLVVPLCESYLEDDSPFHRLAKLIYDLPWPCPQKQWVFAGAARLGVDLLQYMFVDFFNKYYPSGSAARRGWNAGGQPPVLQLGSRVRALWKYPAQYEDELSFEAGEVIIIEGEVPGEELWFRGRIGNRTGLIPSNYVVDESAQLQR